MGFIKDALDLENRAESGCPQFTERKAHLEKKLREMYPDSFQILLGIAQYKSEEAKTQALESAAWWEKKYDQYPHMELFKKNSENERKNAVFDQQKSYLDYLRAYTDRPLDEETIKRIIEKYPEIQKKEIIN